MEKLISMCIADKGRTHYLKAVMPMILKSINASPPVELVIVNYDSPDDLDEYVKTIPEQLVPGNKLNYTKLENKPYFHMAHARNITIKQSTGDYLLVSGTELYPKEMFLPYVREAINNGALYLNYGDIGAFMVIERNLILELGGYDERFEFYGPEDKDFCSRVLRKGIKRYDYPQSLVYSLGQTFTEKYEHYRERSINKMKQEMRAIYEENNANGVIAVNEGIEWGAL
jgi:hypothetical protein